MTALLTLDGEQAQDPLVAGAKAARLSSARRAGLPCLPGLVVPAEASRPALAWGADALERGGSGAARLAAMTSELDRRLLGSIERAGGNLGFPAVVRSSSRFEAGGLWAGAFSSFPDIDAADLGTAVRGVWASAFSPRALERCEATGIAPAEFELAVLVQPQVRPECGGSARICENGTVVVAATRGPLPALMGGWEPGVCARVHPDRRVEGEAAVAALGRRPLQAAADLAQRVAETLGDDLIEWAWTENGIVLLQLSTQGVAPAPTATSWPPGMDHPLAARVARLAHRFPGPLGEQLVLPWAVGLDKPCWAEGVRTRDPAADFAAAVQEARSLVTEAWRELGSDAARLAAATFAAVRSSAPAPALRTLGALRPVDPTRGARVVALLEGVARALAHDGRLRYPRRMWRHTPASVTGLARGRAERGVQPARLGPDRWEPFVHSVVRAQGTAAPGLPGAEGIAAGRVVVVHNPHDAHGASERDIIVAPWPHPGLAPLLWHVGGLVTAAGNPAAHLVEVATGLGVPTVLQADLDGIGGLDRLGASRFIGAVDGAHGVVAFLPS